MLAANNRRTLEKLANQLPWFEGGAGSKTTKRVLKTTPDGTKKGPKWDPKSMQNRAGAAEAFGALSGRPKRLRVKLKGIILGSILGSFMFFKTINNILFEKASKINVNRYQKLKPNKGPKMKPTLLRQSRIFLKWSSLRSCL